MSQPVQPPPRPAGPPPAAAPVTPRRPGASGRWASAPATAGEAPPDPLTGRLRRVVEDLPEWSPLPPGELLVRRPGADGP
ncbi:hypothetical protein RM780_20145 [Streptomyces sp. DSM 44917]|uniref:Uncharacterized protein n=1 Tax=Streptomyces boetiae TaxID=3075541 RepID=A0ABU2LCL6_9ACTN|nr:hypothetical protein [Streptomyces sp. DSM 44917]MDT0309255.1 hypothetical protein [Streptomyces sp. DSM 44917]